MIVKGHRLLTFGKILFYSYKWEKEDLLKKKKKESKKLMCLRCHFGKFCPIAGSSGAVGLLRVGKRGDAQAAHAHPSPVFLKLPSRDFHGTLGIY